MRSLLALLYLVSLPALAAGLLNDTGVNTCLDGTTLAACTVANTGDTAPYPRQDARFGRDAAQRTGKLPAKTGGGAVGFDFTPLDAAGNPMTLTGTPLVPSATPACVRDNVTGLIWEGKTPAYKDITYIWSEANALAKIYRTVGLCGSKIGWRIPTRRELLSLVHRGTKNPAIDTNYFPNTASAGYWSSDFYANDITAAWYVNLDEGATGTNNQSLKNHIRFVRSVFFIVPIF